MRRFAYLLAFLLATSAAALSACRSHDASSPLAAATPDAATDDDDAADDDLGDLGAFCTQYAAGTCTRRHACWNDPTPMQDCVIGVEAKCRMTMRAQFAPAIAAGAMTLDPVESAKCLATPISDWCQSRDYQHLADCQNVFRGALPNGAHCYGIPNILMNASECKEGACIDMPFGGCRGGFCTAYLDAGDTCVTPSGGYGPPGCAPGLDCNADGACAPQPNAGDPCLHLDNACRDTFPALTCAPLADGGNAGYECTGAREEGAPCSAKIECRSGACVDGRCAGATTDAGAIVCAEVACPEGSVCLFGSNPPTCGPPRGPGATCASLQECTAGYGCHPQSDGGMACTPMAAAGEACSPDNPFGPCAPGLTCSTFAGAPTCTPTGANGAACRGTGDDACGVGLTCNGASKTCVPVAKIGAACEADVSCELGAYCDDGTKRCRVTKPYQAACVRDGECVNAGPCTAGKCSTGCVVP